MLFVVGLLAQAVLALLFTIAWHALRRRWAGLLALGFAANGGYYATLAAGMGTASLTAPPPVTVSLFALAGLVLITAAIVDYVGVHGAEARRMNMVAVAVAVVGAAIGLSELMTRAVGFTVMALYVVAWVLLFARAMRREPHCGHGFVIVAVMVYPATVMFVISGWIRPELLSGAGVLPFSVLGATLLTNGLLRAQQQAVVALRERKQAQAALRTLNDSLEQNVAQRTRELRETIEGLESFNRNVSHDLRGPLGGIVGVARLARQQLVAGEKERSERMLDLIEHQAINTVKLVDALLALARASDATLDVREVDSGALVADVIQTLQQGQPPLPVKLAVPMPKVCADPDLLRQVFSNLIGNAIKFARQAPSPQVVIGAEQSDGQTVFHVRDNGMGFDAGDLARLFKPFQRLHAGAHEGYGVGLSIVKRIIDRHGGRVWAEGRQGAGASFYFVLGTARPAAAAPHASTQAASVPR